MINKLNVTPMLPPIRHAGWPLGTGDGGGSTNGDCTDDGYAIYSVGTNSEWLGVGENNDATAGSCDAVGVGGDYYESMQRTERKDLRVVGSSMVLQTAGDGSDVMEFI